MLLKGLPQDNIIDLVQRSSKKPSGVFQTTQHKSEKGSYLSFGSPSNTQALCMYDCQTICGAHLTSVRGSLGKKSEDPVCIVIPLSNYTYAKLLKAYVKLSTTAIVGIR